MLKKTAPLVLSLVLFFATAGLSQAVVMDFPHFTINVPEGWAASMEGDTVYLVAKDNSGSLAVTMARTEGRTVDQIVGGIVTDFDGSNLRLDGLVYTFTFMSGSIKHEAAVSVQGDVYALFITSGENPAIEEMIDSIRNK